MAYKKPSWFTWKLYEFKYWCGISPLSPMGQAVQEMTKDFAVGGTLGTVKIYTGLKPLDANDEPAGTLIASIPLKRMAWKSVFEHAPPEPGWYAVLIRYTAREGFFPRGAYWNGEKWNARSVSNFGDRAPTEEAAEALARINDPEW